MSIWEDVLTYLSALQSARTTFCACSSPSVRPEDSDKRGECVLLQDEKNGGDERRWNQGMSSGFGKGAFILHLRILRDSLLLGESTGPWGFLRF